MEPFNQGGSRGPVSPDDFDQRLVSRLKRIAEAQRAPQHLRARVYADIAAEQGRARHRWIRWDLIAAATGGALVSATVAVVIMIASGNPAQNQEASAWVDAAHQVTGDATLETDQPAFLRSWFESQVDHTVDVPNIPDAELKGGRLAYVGGIRGAAVEYQMHGMSLTYLMVPEGNVMDLLASQGDSVLSWSSRGYQVVMWKQGGGTRALVAPMPKDELSQIAEHCRRTMI